MALQETAKRDRKPQLDFFVKKWWRRFFARHTNPQIAILRLAQPRSSSSSNAFTMISDDDLYKLAIFLGSISMILIVVYHFLEVNSEPTPAAAGKKTS
ncbi:hypothetical protein BBK36DRAFT_1156556 [Trichoderma citrinoviride]|uniref:Dolichyl-diphosphooligosaccharide--protein glycosyltransferase subunit 4 n=1 Tax=Trichoderma citrinoviride TaxID=58853 RepID=A0A2T4BL16_9HYPO|nr:hypothetical protein BBK36DRAFT_1156556 [Trichoderma citrinoviride]PTB70012.1 hypothetical protein BBK36DRAFT_1156556 [Trichoderma citrinoviride]